MGNYKDIPIDEMISLYKKKFTQKQLARIYGVSPTTIKRRIAGYYNEGNPKIYKKTGRKLLQLPMKEICRQRSEGLTYEQIADIYHCSERTISKRIKQYEKTRKGGRNSIVLPIKTIIKEFEAGATKEELRQKYNVSYDTINRRIMEYYEKLGKEAPINQTQRSSKEDIDYIVERFKNRATLEELSRETMRSKKNLYTILVNRLSYTEYIRLLAQFDENRVSNNIQKSDDLKVDKTIETDQEK